MPKINVYLPDDLATAVRAADLPVSAICQKALSEAVQAVATARKAVAALRNPAFNPDDHPQFAERLTGRMTVKLSHALDLAHDAASDAGPIETRHLLIGLLDERDNLAVRLLQTLETDTDDLRDAATKVHSDEPLPKATATDKERPNTPTLWSNLTLSARGAIGAALEAAIDLGHNYLGCEHLILGLLDEPHTGAGQVLHGAGLDAPTLRHSITSAVAGFAHARHNPPEVEASGLNQLIQRLDSIERRLSAAEL